MGKIRTNRRSSAPAPGIGVCLALAVATISIAAFFGFASSPSAAPAACGTYSHYFDGAHWGYGASYDSYGARASINRPAWPDNCTSGDSAGGHAQVAWSMLAGDG